MLEKIEKLLLHLMVIELIIGGGGHLFNISSVSPVSIRIILFVLLLLVYGIRVITNGALLDKEVNTFLKIDYLSISVYLLLFWSAVSAGLGLMHHHPRGLIVTDLLRVVYLLSFFPFRYYFDKHLIQKKTILNYLLWGSLFVAVFTIAIDLFGMVIFRQSYGSYYEFVNQLWGKELFFRPSGGAFYKGHFMMLIGMLLACKNLTSGKQILPNLSLVILGYLSIYLSETRGLILVFAIGIATLTVLDYLGIFFQQGLESFKKKFFSRQNIQRLVIYMVLIISVPLMYREMTTSRFGAIDFEISQQTNGEEVVVEDSSVNKRVELFKASKEISLSSPITFLIGNGYGSKILDRTTGIEMSFVDIQVEQGLVGSILWFNFLFMPILFLLKYLPIKKIIGQFALPISILISIFVLTNINPFLNSPIGIGMVIGIAAINSATLKEKV